MFNVFNIRVDNTNAIITSNQFLNSLGNPVELSRPDKVCQTQQFFQYAIVSDSVIDPTHHPCLHSLPNIFFKAMQGVSAMVDAYLGEREPFLQKYLVLFGTLLNVNELIH